MKHCISSEHFSHNLSETCEEFEEIVETLVIGDVHKTAVFVYCDVSFVCGNTDSVARFTDSSRRQKSNLHLSCHIGTTTDMNHANDDTGSTGIKIILQVSIVA